MVKVGIIGSGFGLYGLLPAFRSTPGCQVTGLCVKNKDRLSKYSHVIGSAKIYKNWRTMLDEEKLDAVAIAVVPDAQYQIAKYAVNKGLHLFAEKPMAVNLSQAKEMLVLATKHKIVHLVDFEFPEITEWVKVKKLLETKTYGQLRQICVNWDFVSYDIKNRVSSWKTDVSHGGGAVSFYFSHSLHYLEHFAGRIENFKKVLSYSDESLNGGEVGVDLILKFKSGATGYAHMSCNSEGLNRHQLTFICEKATIILENEGSFTSGYKITICDDKGIKVLPSQKKSLKPVEDERVKTVKKLTSRFIKAIVKKQKPEPSFTQGVRVQELIEQIRTSNNV